MSSILLIEDDDELRGALERGLSDRDHDVRAAATGIGGLELAVGERPDVVLLDLGLPDVDGLDVIGMIRATSEPAPSRTLPPLPERPPTAEEIAGLKAIVSEHGYELLV